MTVYPLAMPLVLLLCACYITCCLLDCVSVWVTWGLLVDHFVDSGLYFFVCSILQLLSIWMCLRQDEAHVCNYSKNVLDWWRNCRSRRPCALQSNVCFSPWFLPGPCAALNSPFFCCHCLPVLFMPSYPGMLFLVCFSGFWCVYLFFVEMFSLCSYVCYINMLFSF